MAGKDLSTVDLGAGEVFYDSNGSWISLGHSEGGSTITYTPNYSEYMSDLEGDTILKEVMRGENVTLNVTFSQFEKELINKAAPFSVLYTSGTSNSLGFGVTPYGDLFNETIQLKFHPINSTGTNRTDDLTNVDDDFIFWKAASNSELALAFSKDAFRNIPITFRIYKDTTRDSGTQLFVLGDPDNVGLTQTAPALLGTIPDLAATTVAAAVSPIIVMDQQLIDDTVYDGDVGVVVESTGVSVAAAVSYGKTLSQLIDSDITANNPSAVTSPSSITVATADILAQDDILNGLTIKITEDGNTHTTTISDYTLAGVVTLTDNCPFTFTIAAEYTIYGGFIQINPTASLASAVHSIVLAGLQGKNSMYQATPISNKFTTA